MARGEAKIEAHDCADSVPDSLSPPAEVTGCSDLI